jgi:alpha-beta hydrolase superfamily lysophospholipase
LAYGLAAEGVTTMRYDKRTVAHAIRLKENEITPDEEVIQDAISALQTLKSNPDFEGYKVILVGHSLSAMLGPAIAKKASFIAGAALLATPARRFEVIITQQMSYLLSDQPNADTAELRKQNNEFIANFRNGRYKGMSGAQLLGMAPHYWTWLNHYDIIKTGKNLKKPLYLVQGGRDYQVLNEDFELLKAGWAKRPNTTFKYYENMNHQLMEGKGKPSPVEYEIPNHVRNDIIQDMASWMKGLR